MSKNIVINLTHDEYKYVSECIAYMLSQLRMPNLVNVRRLETLFNLTEFEENEWRVNDEK